MSTLERRRQQRRRQVLPVTLYYRSALLPGCQLRDLSRTGAFIETGEGLLPRGAEIELAFALESSRAITMHRLSGRVRHIRDGGIGIEFDFMDYACREAIGLMMAA
jgi:hypothetical protein